MLNIVSCFFHSSFDVASYNHESLIEKMASVIYYLFYDIWIVNLFSLDTGVVLSEKVLDLRMLESCGGIIELGHS